MKGTVQLSDDDLMEIADNRVTEAFRILLARGYEISLDNPPGLGRVGRGTTLARDEDQPRAFVRNLVRCLGGRVRVR